MAPCYTFQVRATGCDSLNVYGQTQNRRALFYFRGAVGRRLNARWTRAPIHCRFFRRARARGSRARCGRAIARSSMGCARNMTWARWRFMPSFLINLCSQTESIRQSSVDAFRAEVQQALALGADFLVVHPGSWKGLTRAEGLRFAAQSIERAIDGLGWQEAPLKILIENAPGAEFSLGSTLEQVAELVACLRACAPVDVCLDTCHLHVAGYMT